MKKFHKKIITTLVIASFVFSFIGSNTAYAAITPSLGAAGVFGVLADHFEHAGATTITGSLGYVDQAGGGGLTILGDGSTTEVNSQARTDAGTAQNAALSTGTNNLANQACTFNFAAGAIDLAIDTTHGQIGVYTPGVYCITGVASIGTAGITLNGSGTYIFRMTGALTSADNSHVYSAGASSCDVFWTPGEATTLGANTAFFGNDIDASGITIGSTTSWIGRALAYGGTITSTANTITSTCTTGTDTVPQATYNLQRRQQNGSGNITVIKRVINDNSGTKVISDFHLFVGDTSVTSGVINSFVTNGSEPYTITETNDPNYIRTFSGDCNSYGIVNIEPGSSKVCVVTNNDIATLPTLSTLHIIKQVINNNGGTAVASDFNLHVKLSGVDVAGSPGGGVVVPGRAYILSPGTYSVSEDANTKYSATFSGACDSNGSVTLSAGTDNICTIINDDIVTFVPSLPKTGFPTQEKSNLWSIVVGAGVLMLVSVSLVLVLRKSKI